MSFSVTPKRQQFFPSNPPPPLYCSWKVETVEENYFAAEFIAGAGRLV